MRISWHCNDCEYLHLDDIVISRVGSFVNVRCIVCKETKTLTNPKSYKLLEEIDDLENKSAIMTKEEAVAFAKKYLEDRKRKGNSVSNPDEPYWTWKIATEYVLLDIIPHLYGEALD